MLAKRIIPCLDVKNGQVVKGVNFVNLRDAGDPVKLAKFYNDSGADELVLLDITATNEKRKTLLEIIYKVSQVINIPFTVGGGIDSIADIREILLAGADKVSLNTAAVIKPQLITQAAQLFGSQCIVLAIDAKRHNNSWNVFTNSSFTETKLDAITWALEGVQRGAGEILLTSIGQEGTQRGYDLKLTSIISKNVSVPVIASGGAGSMTDFLKVFEEGQADAALAASLFHFGEMRIKDLKNFLNANQISVRITS